jgi:hypothetical protein
MRRPHLRTITPPARVTLGLPPVTPSATLTGGLVEIAMCHELFPELHSQVKDSHLNDLSYHHLFIIFSLAENLPYLQEPVISFYTT